MPNNKKKGRAWLIRVHDGVSAFVPLVALTGKSLKINNSRIDVTTPDETTPEGEIWRETLDDVKSLDASGDYKVIGDAGQDRLVTIAMSTAAEEQFEIVVPGVGTFAGWFSVNLEFGDDGAVTGSISLESNGKPTFTAEA